MLICAVLFFIALLALGFKTKKLNLKSVLKGFVPFLLSLVATFIVGFFGWSILLKIYPHYTEILQGFTYNGHAYIGFFVSLSLALCWFLYSKFQKEETTANIFVAPLFLWLIINIVLAVYLKGAAYFILPYYCALVSFWILIKKETSSALMHLLLATPAIFMFSPLIQILPVGLGLETMVLSTVLTVLIFGLLLSFLSTFAYKKRASIGFMFTALCLFIFAHATSDFNDAP